MRAADWQATAARGSGPATSLDRVYTPFDLRVLGVVTHTTPIPATGLTRNGPWWDAANQRLLIVSWGANARVFGWVPGQRSVSAIVHTAFKDFDGVVQD